MFNKLLLAAGLTFSLNLFVGVKHTTNQPTLLPPTQTPVQTARRQFRDRSPLQYLQPFKNPGS
ncbi:MAG: hypothetical protein HC866_18955 [Leptolyngbyaceae cyanobacterium RU_5_1]|nr:hypothetical protein [Leptolyngbyaceae cyanobacterium RU_5_1]